jgi:hypothetical protein
LTFVWGLWIGDHKLSSWNWQQIYINHAKSIDILDHWSKPQNIPHRLIRSIDWEACQDAIKKLGLNCSLWIPKWLVRFAPVRKVLQQNRLQDHVKCPQCAELETTSHVVLCKAPNAQQQWDSSLLTLDQWLIKANTLPDLRTAILTWLEAWQEQTVPLPPPPSYNWPGVNNIAIEQYLTGWQAFLEGVMLQAWAA